MSGYGSVDDESERAMIRVEELVALSRSLLPTGPGTSHCTDCGEPIPEARRRVMPSARHCVYCKDKRHDTRPTYRQPWAT